MATRNTKVKTAKKELRKISVGMMSEMESILGNARLQALFTEQEVSMTYAEKSRLLQIVTGREDVDAMSLEEAEETLGFFLISLLVSTVKGRTKVLYGLLTNLLSNPVSCSHLEAFATTLFRTEDITNSLSEHLRLMSATLTASVS